MSAEDKAPGTAALRRYAPLLLLGALCVGALVLRAWPVALIAIAVFATFFAGQAWARSRARAAHAAAAATGGGEWHGRLSTETAEWLWPRGLPGVLHLLYDNGLPVRLCADSAGITVAPRGMLASRIKRLPAIGMSWAEIAGARERDRGYTDDAAKISLVALSTVTIDVVGPPAYAWDWADDWVDHPDHADAGDDVDAEEHAAFLAETYGPDWRPGTAPLLFTSAAPEGLVELVSRRAAGRPHESVP